MMVTFVTLVTVSNASDQGDEVRGGVRSGASRTPRNQALQCHGVRSGEAPGDLEKAMKIPYGK